MKKISTISSTKIKNDPSKYEMKINETMAIFNRCYEEMSKTYLKGQTQNEISFCDTNTYPDFSN